MAEVTRIMTLPLDIYVRVSRVGGRDGDSFVSPQLQEERCRAMATARGFEVGEVITDLDVSGGTMQRPGLNRALQRIKDGQSGGIIVARLDRFARTLRGALDVLEELERAGGVLVEADGNWDTSSPSGRFGRDLLLRVAQLYREQVAEQWDDAKRKAIERGVHPTAYVPFGYVRERGKPMVPDPATADHVHALFRLRAQGASWRDLCEHLEREAMLSPRGGHWTITSVRQIVMNRAYLGEARMGKHVNEAAHEPLVTRAAWNAAQRTWPGRTRLRDKEGARLAGLVFCASCGGRLTPELPSERLREREGMPPTIERGCGYYKCRSRNATANAGCTSRAIVRMDDLDALALDSFMKRYEKAVGQFDDEPQPPETAHLVAKLEQADDALQTLVEDPLSLAGLSTENRAKVLKNAQSAVDAIQAEIEAVEVTHETSVVNVWHLSDLFTPDDFREASIPEQRRLLALGIERIEVAKGSRHELQQRVRIVWVD